MKNLTVNKKVNTKGSKNFSGIVISQKNSKKSDKMGTPSSLLCRNLLKEYSVADLYILFD